MYVLVFNDLRGDGRDCCGVGLLKQSIHDSQNRHLEFPFEPSRLALDTVAQVSMSLSEQMVAQIQPGRCFDILNLKAVHAKREWEQCW